MININYKKALKSACEKLALIDPGWFVPCVLYLGITIKARCSASSAEHCCQVDCEKALDKACESLVDCECCPGEAWRSCSGYADTGIFTSEHCKKCWHEYLLSEANEQ